MNQNVNNTEFRKEENKKHGFVEVDYIETPLVCMPFMAHNTYLSPLHLSSLCSGFSTCINFYIAIFVFLFSSQ